MMPEAPSQRETAAGLVILTVLSLIAVGIWWVRQTPNPAVVVFESAGPQTTDSAPAGDRIPVPEGFLEMSPPEAFDADRLSDKIDGKAELYLAADFQQLTARRLEAGEGAGAWMEVFAYRMENPKSAFAVFSAQQRADGEPVGRFRHGYRTENALFFVHGPFYVEIVSSAPSESPERLLSVAEAFAAAHLVAEAAVSEGDLFPEEGLQADSIVLQSANVFGFERLDDVFVARYRLKGAEAAAFVSKRAIAAEASDLAAAYADFLVRFGGKPMIVDFPAKDAKMIELFGVYELVFSSGDTLAGVHEAESPQAALALGRRLFERLSRGGS